MKWYLLIITLMWLINTVLPSEDAETWFSVLVRLSHLVLFSLGAYYTLEAFSFI
jgi:hypothetical protein